MERTPERPQGKPPEPEQMDQDPSSPDHPLKHIFTNLYTKQENICVKCSRNISSITHEAFRCSFCMKNTHVRCTRGVYTPEEITIIKNNGLIFCCCVCDQRFNRKEPINALIDESIPTQRMKSYERKLAEAEKELKGLKAKTRKAEEEALKAKQNLTFQKLVDTPFTAEEQNKELAAADEKFRDVSRKLAAVEVLKTNSEREVMRLSGELLKEQEKSKQIMIEKARAEASLQNSESTTKTVSIESAKKSENAKFIAERTKLEKLLQEETQERIRIEQLLNINQATTSSAHPIAELDKIQREKAEIEQENEKLKRSLELERQSKAKVQTNLEEALAARSDLSEHIKRAAQGINARLGKKARKRLRFELDDPNSETDTTMSDTETQVTSRVGNGDPIVENLQQMIIRELISIRNEIALVRNETNEKYRHLAAKIQTIKTGERNYNMSARYLYQHRPVHLVDKYMLSTYLMNRLLPKQYKEINRCNNIHRRIKVCHTRKRWHHREPHRVQLEISKL